ncbi:MAG: LamG-like jellyroll fold domain-containing protein, partial [Bacteroidota bacterium]
MSLFTRLRRIAGAVLLVTGIILAQVPTISSFTPLSATAGTSVTITGTNFSATASSNIVRFGSVTGTVTAASTTSLTVTVPNGSLYGQISVTVNGYTRFSKYAFSPKSSATSTVTTGTFYQSGTHTLTSVSNKMQPNKVRIGDIDGDGKSDLVVSGNSYITDSVSVLRNLGTSGMLDSTSFAPKKGFYVGNSNYNIIKDISLADFDNDGKLDIAVDENYTGMYVMRNQSTSGSVSFASPVLLEYIGQLEQIGIADVDCDGKIDIIAAANGYGVYIFRNTSSGSGNISFAASVTFATGIGNSLPNGVSFADLNNDGKPDMVVSNFSNQSISVFKNIGTPGSITSGSFAAKVDFSVGSFPSRVITGDIDGNGNIDIIATAGGYWDPRHIAVFRNTTTADSITLAASVNIGTSYYGATEPLLRDLTGDNKPDIYITTAENQHAVFTNTSTSGSVSFGSPVYFPNTSTAAFGIADLDNDGNADVVVPNYTANDPKVKFMRNNTGPRFSVDRASVNFGYVVNNTTKQDSVIVTNPGGSTLSISSVASNNVKLTVTPAFASISAGGTQKFYLTFAPQSGSDTTATVTFTHNAPGTTNTITARHVTQASFSVAGGPGNALSFSEETYSDYVDIPYSSALSTNVTTMEAWVKQTASYGSGAIISNGPNNYTGINIYPSYYGGWAASVGNNSLYSEAISFTARQQNVWTHLAATFQNDTLKLYVNGVLAASTVYPLVVNPSYPVRLGNYSGTQSPWYSGFHGEIDEVRIWNVVRTPDQIVRDMNRPLSGMESGLAGYWKFDEGSGTSGKDATQNGRDALFPASSDYHPSWTTSAAAFPVPWFRKSLTDMAFGSVQTNKTSRDSFYIRNLGGSSLSITDITSSGNGFSVSPTSATIASDDSAKFVVSFLPTVNGGHSATLTISHNASGGTAYHYLTGTGATASYSVNSSTRDFGSVQVGVSKTDSFTVTNSGAIALSIDSIRSSLSSYTVTPTSASVPAAGSQKFTITFASALPTGAANGTISVYHSASGAPGIVNVTGTKVQQAAAGAGTAALLDGTNDFVTRAVITTAVNNISFEAWVKWDGQSGSGNKYIFYNGHTGSSGYGLFIEGSSSPSNSLTILNGGIGYARSSYVLTPNQWQHVAVVRDAGVWTLYVDGVQQTLSNTSITPNTPAGATYIGSNINGAEAFKGTIDEVRFWSVARTQTQIQSNYNSLVGTESGLLAYYRFDENYGTTAYDNSGNNRNAVLTNGAAYTASTAYLGTPAYSISSSSLAFGSVQAGTPKVDSVTISNTGGGLLNIGSITTGNAAYTITPSNVAVRPSSSQKFYMTFLAPAPAAAQNTSLSVTHNAVGSPGNITVTGASVFQAASSAGNGLTFSGTSKFVDIASNAALTSSSFTVEMWLKIGATWSWSAVIDKGRNIGSNWYILTTNSGNGDVQGALFGMAGGAELGYQWGDANWHHIAATFDGVNQKFYVDGVLRSSTTGVVYSPTNSTIRIGGRQDTTVFSLNPFNGNIDEVRLWNTARTQSEIQQSYSSLSGNESGLVSYFRFDESSGTTAFDATGNGRNGTLVNGLPRSIPSTAAVGSPVFSSVSSKNIGPIYLTGSRQDSVTISNTGNGVLNISAISSDNAQFSVSPSTLNILTGSSAKIYITALPTALGVQSGTISFTHNASGSPTAVSVSATAIVPSITSFTPSSGPVGTSIVIKGTGFNTTPANNTVFFGAVKGTVTASTDTSITVTVPTGANYAPITVTTNNLQAYSRNGFIVTFSTSNSITSGSFAANQSVTALNNGYGMTFSDIDGDGKPDAVIGTQSTNGLSILRNTGTSGAVSFAAALNFATVSNGLDVAAGDLDGDGKPDVVATKQSSGFSIFRNTSTPGSISFAARIDSALNLAHGAAIGDLDGDGKPELIVVNNSTASVRIYRNTSTPGTIMLTSVLSAATGAGPREIHLIDFDGDGRLDIATNNFSAGTVSVLRNTSTVGSFSFDAKLDLTGASGTFGIAVGDLTGDGKPEVVSSGASVRVYYNTSTSGSLSFAAAVSYTASSDRTVTIGDFSGDGKPDIASNNTGGTVSVLKNTYTSGAVSGSSFAAKVDFAAGSGLWNLRSSDVDGDGKIDLNAISQTGSSMSVLRNTVPLPATFTPNPSAVAFGNVALGSNKIDSIRVKNTGGVALSITAAASTIAQYSISPSTATVAVGDSQKFTITFTPTQSSAVNAKLVFTSNSTAASDTVPVSGTGTGPVMTLSASSRSFGSVLVASNRKDSIYLKNTGNAVMNVTNVVSDNAEFTVNQTSFSVNALDSAKLIITLSPITIGIKTATVQITHNGTTSPTSLTVDGRGIQPVFTSSAANIAFGNVGYYQTRSDSLTVSNTGVDTLVITSAATSNAVYSVSPASATIAPSGSRVFTVTYAPVSVSATNDTLRFTHNAGTVSTIPLSGTGALLPAASAGNALDLNGSNQYADLADGVWFNSNFTIETWVYIRSVANYSRVIDFANGPGSNNVIITASEGTSGKIGFHIFNGASATNIVTPNAVPLNTWVHVACVFNNGTGRIYLDGIEVVSGGLNYPTNVVRTLNYIGKSQYADPHANLRMDEFRIWNVARTAAQIRSGMNISLAGSESGLTAYLRFDEQNGTVIRNFTGNGLNAQLVNGATRTQSSVKIPAPHLMMSKQSFSLGSGAPGTPLRDTVWVTNYGGIPLQIDSVRAVSSELTITPVSGVVASGDSLRFIATLTASLSGIKSDTVRFYSNTFDSTKLMTATAIIFSAEPGVRDSLVTASKIRPYAMTLKWKNGDGANHLVLIKEASAVNAEPADGSIYSANTVFGSGSQLGSGNFAVYSGTADSVNVTNLHSGVTYHVTVTAFNGTGATVNYLTPAAAVNSITIPFAVNSPLPGSAVSLNGSSNYLSVNTLTDLSGDSLTIEYWFKGSDLVSAVRYQSGGDYLVAGWNASGTKVHILSNDGGVNNGIPVGASAEDGNWHHVAMTWKRNTVNGFKSYLDGQLVAQRTSSDAPIVNMNTPTIIGSYFGFGEFTHGLLDEIRIWRSNRSAQQVRENMHRRISGDQPGLLAYFQFTEGNGTMSVDSIKGHVASFINTPAWQTSTVPFGAGNSASVTAVQSGVQSLAEVTMNLTEGFDNNSDVTATGIVSEPNVLPDGYLSAVGNRYFIVNTFGSTGSFTANISLNFGAGIIDSRADDLPGGVKLFRRSSNSDGVWTEIGGASSASSATGIVTWTGITSAGQFAAVYDETALPVELVSFTASSIRLNTELKWSTATEVNNHGFEVERRAIDNGKMIVDNWSKVGFVEGNGNSNSAHEYSYT